MEFGTRKCAMVEMKIGKRHLTDRMKLPIQDNIRVLGHHQTSGDERKNQKKSISGEPESYSRQN